MVGGSRHDRHDHAVRLHVRGADRREVYRLGQPLGVIPVATAGDVGDDDPALLPRLQVHLDPLVEVAQDLSRAPLLRPPDLASVPDHRGRANTATGSDLQHATARAFHRLATGSRHETALRGVPEEFHLNSSSAGMPSSVRSSSIWRLDAATSSSGNMTAPTEASSPRCSRGGLCCPLSSMKISCTCSLPSPAQPHRPASPSRRAQDQDRTTGPHLGTTDLPGCGRALANPPSARSSPAASFRAGERPPVGLALWQSALLHVLKPRVRSSGPKFITCSVRPAGGSDGHSPFVLPLTRRGP